MILGILLIGLVGLIAFFHYIQGFFSATISAVIAIIASVLAVGWHEDIIAMAKPGKFADSASAMILCGLYATIYLICRVIFDKTVPGNVRVKAPVDKVGGAAMGVVAGIFTAGVAAVAVQSMPMAPAVGGHARYSVNSEREVHVPMPEGQGKDRKVYDEMRSTSGRFEATDESKLLLPVDDILIGLVSSASNGCLAGRQPFTTIHPNLLQEYFGQRLGMEIGSKRTANNLGPITQVTVPSLFFVTTGGGVVDAETPQVRGETPSATDAPGRVTPAKDGPLVATFKQLIAKKQPVFVARVQIARDATDADNLFRVSTGAVRLVLKTSEGTKNFFPVGTVDETNTFYLNRMDDPIVVTSTEDMYVDFAFDVNPDDVAEPATGGKAERVVKQGVFLEVKRLARIDLAEALGVVVTTAWAKRAAPLPLMDPVMRKSVIKRPPAAKEPT